MATDFSEPLLKGDLDLLTEHGTDDKTLSLLATDHAGRTKTLIEAIQCPAFARALALTLCRVLLDTANGIDGASYQEGELVNVGV